MKALTLLTTGLLKIDKEKELRDECPRASLYEETLHTDMLSEESLLHAPLRRRWLYRLVPPVFAEVLEAFSLRKNYDVVISWSDPHTLLFAGLLKLFRKRVPLVALMFWISKPKKAALLKRVHSHIDTIVLWTSTHKEFAINELGIPPEKIRFIPYYVDQKFWRPMPRQTDMICSVGVEMRDYPTLLEAMRGLDIHCHIAAGNFRGKLFRTVSAIYEHGPLPDNVTVEKLGPNELRNLYARSRFVVVPLLHSDSDNGLTTILEAMAMGKTVICSQIRGQRDVIQDGKTGIFVPQGDSRKLREVILDLWNNPGKAEAMGREARRYVELHTTWEHFINNIKTFAEEVGNSRHLTSASGQRNRTLARTHATGTSIPL